MKNISDGFLTPSALPNKDIPPMSGWLAANSILLHPEDMRANGFSLTTPVLVGPEKVFAAWPHAAVKPSTIAFTDASKSAGEQKLIKLPIARQVNEVVLSPPNEWFQMYSTSHFAAFLKTYFESAFFLSWAPSAKGIKRRFEVEFMFYGMKHIFHLLDYLVDDIEMWTGPVSKLTLDENPAQNDDPADEIIVLQTHSQTKFRLVQRDKEDSGHCIDMLISNINQSLDRIGGLRSVKDELKRYVIDPVLLNCTAQKEPMPGVRRILLHGETGTGKTMLISVLSETLPSRKITSRTLDLKQEGSRQIPGIPEFKGVLLLDNLDVFLTGKRSGGIGDNEGAFMNFLDDLGSNGQTWLVAATSDVSKLSLPIRRRFDLEIEVPVPTPYDRCQILNLLVKKWAAKADVDTLNESHLVSLSDTAHSYTGSDLDSVVKLALRFKEVSMFGARLVKAFKLVPPSAMRQIMLQIPKVKWSDIGGQDKVKFDLRQCIQWPFTHPQIFKEMAVSPPKGILLYGPPGCSKTMIARAVATESSLNFLSVKGPEIFSKWVGDSERAVRELFSRARKASPCVVFLDEIDAIAVTRKDSNGGSVGDRVVASLLTEMDGLEGGDSVVVIAATNRPDCIDSALLRPGRFDRLVHVPLPDPNTRREIFSLHLKRMRAGDIDLDVLVELTEGYSGAEVAGLCHEAGLHAISTYMMSENGSFDSVYVKMIDFESAMERVVPRSDPILLKLYETFDSNLL